MNIPLKQRPYKLFTKKIKIKVNRPQVNPIWVRGPTALFLLTTAQIPERGGLLISSHMFEIPRKVLC